MAQFDHVDHTHCCRLVKPVSCSSVAQICLSEARKSGLVGVCADVVKACAVEDRGAELEPEFFACPSENSFIYLSQVHTRRYTERVEDYVDRRPVFEERHIFVPYDLCHDTFVSVAAGHLVTHADLPLLGHIDLGKLHHSVRKLVADLDLVEHPLVLCCKFLMGNAVVVDELADHHICILVGCPLA